jgi:hypothetical protein
MGLLDRIFRRPPPIRDAAALAEFIDENAAFLMQKGIYEYARARAGHYAKVMLRERMFLDAVERARWQAFPLGLAMVAEVVEGVLRPHSGDDRRTVVDALAELVLDVFDRYPVPAAFDSPVSWQDARVTLAQRLNLIGAHAPKAAMDIGVPYAQAYFDLMPINEKLRAPDFPTLRNYLRVSLINVHDRLTQRLDAPAVVDELRRPAGQQ